MQQPKIKPTMSIGRAALAVFGLLLLLLVLFFYPETKSSPVTPLVKQVNGSAALPVSVRAQIDRNAMGIAEPADLRVTVTNQGTVPLRSLQLQVIAPGFALKRKDTLPVIRNGMAAPPVALGPGESFTYFIPVEADARSGSYSMTSVLSWQRERYETESITLGPVHFDNALGASHFARLGQRLASLIKDLTLPLILLWLTNRFAANQRDKDDKDRTAREERARLDQEAQHKREAAELEAQREKALLDREGERERLEAQAVRQILLTRVMEYAEHSYMPMIAAARSAVQVCLALPKPASNAEALRGIYLLLKLYDTFDKHRRERGAIFLKNLDAEKLVQASWVIVKIAIVEILSANDLDMAARRGVLDSLERFRSHKAAFEAAAGRLEAWIKGDEKSEVLHRIGPPQGFVGAMDLFQGVLLYETNRPFMQHWYASTSEWQFTQDVLYLPTPEQLPADRQTYVNDLLRIFPKYCNKPLQTWPTTWTR